MDQRRINSKLPVAREGLPVIGGGIVFTIILLLLQYVFIATLVLVFTLFVVYFFRDPDRRPVDQENAILTPADGRVLSIERVNNGDKSIKISIFMSIFDAHINRIPIRGIIDSLSYHPGKFFSANTDKSSIFNERNIVTLETDDKKKIVFIQIAGLIARRIACWVEKGDYVETGQRFGLIRFGSRLEIYLPIESKITVKEGEKIKAGQTVIGYIA